ncbi:MAG: alpha/beta hydrolase [Granulosicoccaceae bacterium]
MSWHVNDRVVTSASFVAAGSAGEGEPIVLAHGWPWSSFSWHRLIPMLSKKYQVFWYDMPGYGQSDKHPEQLTSLDIQGQVFSEMLEHWGLKNPIVVAHDFGGATTLRAHLLHRCEYERLVLMNIVAMRPWGSEFFDHVGKHVDAFLGLPPHIHQAVVESYIKGALVNPIAPDDIEHLVAPWLTEEGSWSFYRQFAQADEAFTKVLEPLYKDMRCKVDILWGEDDPWIPIERGRELHRFIPQASFAALPGVGHMPQLEAAQQVLSCLDACWG